MCPHICPRHTLLLCLTPPLSLTPLCRCVCPLLWKGQWQVLPTLPGLTHLQLVHCRDLMHLREVLQVRGFKLGFAATVLQLYHKLCRHCHAI